MLRRHIPVRTSLAPAIPLAALALVAWACGSTAAGSPATGVATSAEAAPAAPAATPAPTSTPAPAAGAAAPDASMAHIFAGLDPLHPPGGEWSIDEQGRHYFPYEIPKHEGHYLRDGNRVIIDHGLSLEVVEEKPSSFVVKIFRMDQPGAPRSVPPQRPTDADREAVAATYRAELGVADRLTLQPYGEGLPTEGQWRQSFELVDIDGDDDLDILHGPPRKGSSAPQLFVNLGGGRWRQQEIRAAAGRELDYGDIVVADFSGDGRLDIALAVHLRGFKVLVAEADGSFREWGGGLDWAAAGEDTPEFTSRTLVAVDWNRDGRTDLMALGEGPRMSIAPGTQQRFDRGGQGPVVFLNRGDGTWERRDQGTGRDKVYADELVLVDLDGDGLRDFVTGSRNAGQRMILHYGLPDGGWRESLLSTLRPGIVTAVASADFDGDGRPDLALGHATVELGATRSGLDLHLQVAPGEWRRVPVIANEGRIDNVTAVATGDVDGDGNVDLVALSERGERIVLLGDGKGGMSRETSPELPEPDGCRGYHVALADLDGDRRAEMLFSFAGEVGTREVILNTMGCARQGGLEAWKAAPRGR